MPNPTELYALADKRMNRDAEECGGGSPTRLVGTSRSDDMGAGRT